MLSKVLSRTTSATSKPSSSRLMATLAHAKIEPRRSVDRGHADHGWLNTYHTFSFASYHSPRFQSFGPLRVLNEDRVAAGTGFPTHHHSNFEIFSYILSGELTHRDSVHGEGQAGTTKDDFFVMKRGDVQFTTGGTGISHSEYNENKNSTVHFLQIWVKPWAQGLPPTYHTANFDEAAKRQAFVPLISPLAAGRGANAAQEKEATPRLTGTIPIHADLVMAASIIPAGTARTWRVGASDGAVDKKQDRRAYVHLPMTKGGKASIKLAGRDDAVLAEGDGAFVTGLAAGDELTFESVGSEDAEVVVLDSD